MVRGTLLLLLLAIVGGAAALTVPTGGAGALRLRGGGLEHLVRKKASGTLAEKDEDEAPEKTDPKVKRQLAANIPKVNQ